MEGGNGKAGDKSEDYGVPPSKTFGASMTSMTYCLRQYRNVHKDGRRYPRLNNNSEHGEHTEVSKCFDQRRKD